MRLNQITPVFDTKYGPGERLLIESADEFLNALKRSFENGKLNPSDSYTKNRISMYIAIAIALRKLENGQIDSLKLGNILRGITIHGDESQMDIHLLNQLGSNAKAMQTRDDILKALSSDPSDNDRVRAEKEQTRKRFSSSLEKLARLVQSKKIEFSKPASYHQAMPRTEQPARQLQPQPAY